MAEGYPAHVQLAIMSRDYVVSRAIHALAQLSIADYMSDSPIPVNELAQRSQTKPELLERILHFLSLYGVFAKHPTGYALTPLSHPLRTDDPNSIKSVLAMVDEYWWNAFAHLETTLRTGTPGFELANQSDFFDFLSQHPVQKNQFKQGLAQLAGFDDPAIAKGLAFDRFTRLVNIGEGKEHLTQTLQQYYPHLALSTVYLPLQDLPDADAYLLKGVLHDFNDSEVLALLKSCHHQMNPQSSLIIAEQVMPAEDQQHTNQTMDIIMMVLVGGRQRPLLDWQHLIESAGFKLKAASPTAGIFTLMEFLRC